MKNWKDGLERWPGGLPQVELTSENRFALLIIDMQHVCAHRDYGQGIIMKKKFPAMWKDYFDRLEKVVIPNQQRLLGFFRRRGWRVIYTTVGPELPDGSDMFARRRWRDQERIKITHSPHFFSRGTLERSILEAVRPQPQELVVNKNSSGAFNSSALDQFLRNMGIDSLVIAGVVTNACVETTARDAADRGYNCIVVEDGCPSYEPLSHEMTLRSFARLFGKVLSTRELIRLLSRLHPSRPHREVRRTRGSSSQRSEEMRKYRKWKFPKRS